MWQLLERIGDEFLQAVAADLESLAANPQLYRDASYLVSQALNLDVTGDLIKPCWDAAYNHALSVVQDVVSASEEYPEETGELIKEKSADFADSFAEALKKRKEKKMSEKGENHAV